MKQDQQCLLFCFLAVAIAVHCGHTVGGDCVYKEISGYISINTIDTASSKGLNVNQYYVWCRFISSDYSDTTADCRTIINTGCLNNGVLALDSLIPCIWIQKISGGCAPDYIKINSIPDTCYTGYPFIGEGGL